MCEYGPIISKREPDKTEAALLMYSVSIVEFPAGC